MISCPKSRICVVGLHVMAAAGRVGALEMLHFCEGKDFVRIMEDATGVKMGGDGSVCAASFQKDTLLKITAGKIEACKLSPAVFDGSDPDGVDLLAWFPCGRQPGYRTNRRHQAA